MGLRGSRNQRARLMVWVGLVSPHSVGLPKAAAAGAALPQQAFAAGQFQVSCKFGAKVLRNLWALSVETYQEDFYHK